MKRLFVKKPLKEKPVKFNSAIFSVKGVKPGHTRATWKNHQSFFGAVALSDHLLLQGWTDVEIIDNRDAVLYRNGKYTEYGYQLIMKGY